MEWRRRLARWSRGLGWMAFALGLLPLLLLVVGKGMGLPRPSFWGDGFLLATWLPALASALTAAALAGRASRADGRLARAGEDLAVTGATSGTRRIRRDEVESAVIVRGPTSTSVEIALSGGEELIASAQDETEAREILGRTGIDPRRRRARVAIERMPRWLPVATALGLAFVLGPVLLPIGAATPAGAVAWMVALVAAMSAALSASSTVEVVVGTDGLQLTRGRARRFVALGAIAGARPSRGGMELVRHDGTVEPVRLYWLASPGRTARRDAIVASIEEAIRARREADAAPVDVADAVARRDRPVGAWRVATEALVRDGGYRARALSADALVRLVERPDAPPDQRIGAAIALAAAGAPGAPDRIRIAARACAADRVRIALEQVADGTADDAALEEALAADERVHATP